jgi:hypothetical protein
MINQSLQDPTSTPGPDVDQSGPEFSSRTVRHLHTFSALSCLADPKWILENDQNTAPPKQVKECIVCKNAMLNGMDLSNPVPRVSFNI